MKKKKKRYEKDHDFLSFKNIKINTSKLIQFSIHRNCVEKIHWNDVDFWSIEIRSEKAHRNKVDFWPIEISLKNVRWNNGKISPIKITLKKVYQTMSIFQLSKLLRRKYVERTSIFCPSKFDRKSTSKQRGNSSIFYFRHIDVIWATNRPRFHVLCQLGKCILYMKGYQE